MTQAAGFPPDLLRKSWGERLAYFQNYTLAHPLLVEAKDKLMAAVSESEPNSLVFVFGPTGVGKTTLRMRAQQLITDGMRTEIEKDISRLPVVGVEATAPECGNFSWSDHFRRVLLAMNEPLVDYKHTVETVRSGPRSHIGSKPTTAEYRHAVEQALEFRRPAAIMIDEAQHLSKMASGRRLLDQLDVLKSIANQTRTVHVLFGTYDLLAFRNLNGQLSRRSVDVHFRRYRAESGADQQVFINVLQSFAHHLPLPETPDLRIEWEFLYERSAGCAGILKQWLTRALHSALRRAEKTITAKNLEDHALSVSQCETILSEAVEGEGRLTESSEAKSRLHVLLGLPAKVAANPRAQAQHRLPVLRNRRPGQRQPRRDPIGARANAVSV